MLRLSSGAIGLLLALNILASDAGAQWGYPRGYGGYGMSKWGQDPGAGYMAGLGSFARGQGAYQEDKAKADAINVETMVKWNKSRACPERGFQGNRLDGKSEANQRGNHQVSRQVYEKLG